MAEVSIPQNCCVYWLYDAGCSVPEKDGYVGITSQLPRRIRNHRRSKRFPSFKVKVLFQGSRHECSAIEFNLRPQIGIGWNFGTGGKSTHGTLGKKLSEKTRRKMSAAHVNRPLKEKKRLAKIFGQSWVRLNKSRIGKPFSDEHRAKLSAAKIGNKNGLGKKGPLGVVRSQEFRDGVSKRMKGKRTRLGAKLTDEQRSNISAGRMGKGLGNQNWRKRKAVIAQQKEA